MTEVYDAIVVGAGYGGVTCAALLAERGLRVALLDRNARAGGKAMTVHGGGYGYELWPIAGGPSDQSRFHELAGVLGLDPGEALLLPDFGGEFRYVDESGELHVVAFSARPSADPAAVARTPEALGATPEETNRMLAFVGAVFSTPEDDLPGLDDVDALSWLRGFGLGTALESYMLAVLNLLFVVAVDRLPVSETIRTLRDFFLGGGGRYHRGGFGTIAEAAAEHVVKKGGEFHPLTRVERLLVENGRVVGVATADREFRSRVVISNAGIQPTVLKIAEPGDFPGDYVERVRALEPSWAFVGVRYFLDKVVFHQPMVLQFSPDAWWDDARFRAAAAGDWAEEPLIFVAVPSLYDPSLAPEGHQVALAGTMCSPDPDSPMNEAAVAKVQEVVERWWPEVREHASQVAPYTARHASAASRDAVVAGQGGECIGLGQVIGQTGASKPAVRAPLPGLYFVGCDAGGYGCGTHQAVDSGFKVAEIVAGDMDAFHA